MPKLKSGLLALSVGLAIAFATGAFAQPADPAATPVPAAVPAAAPISLELNKIEVIDGACTGFFVMRNEGDTGLGQIDVQLFVFNPQGRILSAYSLLFENIRAGSEKVGIYQIGEGACTDVGRLLVNEVRECKSSSGQEIADCAARFSASTLGDVDLVY